MLIRNLLVPYIFILLSILPVKAHDDYPAACCSGRDCKPVECSALEDLSDGGIKYGKFVFTKGQVKYLNKPGCHVCIQHIEDEGGSSADLPTCVFPLRGT